MRFLFLYVVMGITGSLYAEDFDRQQILERIAPIGQVHLEKKAGEVAPAAKTVESTPTKAPGQAIYESRCIVCHAEGVAGAPKFRNASDWGPRMANTNIEGLVAIAVKGLNAMPPKGTCGECSEDDIKAAIQYMLPKK